MASRTVLVATGHTKEYTFTTFQRSLSHTLMTILSTKAPSQGLTNYPTSHCSLYGPKGDNLDNATVPENRNNKIWIMSLKTRLTEWKRRGLVFLKLCVEVFRVGLETFTKVRFVELIFEISRWTLIMMIGKLKVCNLFNDCCCTTGTCFGRDHHQRLPPKLLFKCDPRLNKTLF